MRPCVFCSYRTASGVFDAVKCTLWLLAPGGAHVQMSCSAVQALSGKQEEIAVRGRLAGGPPSQTAARQRAAPGPKRIQKTGYCNYQELSISGRSAGWRCAPQDYVTRQTQARAACCPQAWLIPGHRILQNPLLHHPSSISPTTTY